MTQLTAFQEGQRLFLKGDLPASIEAFSSAIDNDLELFKSHISRGAAHLKIGELDEALADFNEAVSLGDNPGRAFFYRGIAYLNKGSFMDEYAISRNMFERSMALFDGDRGPWKIVLTNDEVIRMSQWQ